MRTIKHESKAKITNFFMSKVKKNKQKNKIKKVLKKAWQTKNSVV